MAIYFRPSKGKIKIGWRISKNFLNETSKIRVNYRGWRFTNMSEITCPELS
jgi:hypothetical protein